MSTRLAALAKASVEPQSVRLEIALLNARGFNKIMARGAKRNRTLIDFNFIKKKKIREDEENEQDDGQQGKH